MIPTYHCARYLEQALRSVLDQDPGPEQMQIVVVDDHSVDDDPEAVVQAVGGGRVAFVRNEHNQGHVRTFNACLQLSRGHWVHVLHGDDWVEDGFYAAADRGLELRPDLAAAVSRYRYLHEQTGQLGDGPLLRPTAGVLEDWLELLGAGQRLQAPSIAVRRSTYERIGGFDLGIQGYGEDWEMWLRVAAAGAVWWDPTARAVYRIRAGSLSDPARLHRNMDDMRHVLALNARTLAEHLPPRRVDALTRAAERSLALALLRRARRALDHGDVRGPWPSIGEAARFWPHPETAAVAAGLTARWGLQRVGARRAAAAR